ncbi:MAG: copper chaperone PCu(A)C, partial [Rhodobacterales bacterium]
MKRCLLIPLLCITPAFVQADVLVRDAWARASILADRPGAAYLSLQSDSGDRLLSVNTPAAEKAVLHASETDSNGITRMIHLDVLELPAGEVVTLEPGGIHLMLMGLHEKLQEGSAFAVDLNFE